MLATGDKVYFQVAHELQPVFLGEEWPVSPVSFVRFVFDITLYHPPEFDNLWTPSLRIREWILLLPLKSKPSDQMPQPAKTRKMQGIQRTTQDYSKNTDLQRHLELTNLDKIGDLKKQGKQVLDKKSSYEDVMNTKGGMSYRVRAMIAPAPPKNLLLHRISTIKQTEAGRIKQQMEDTRQRIAGFSAPMQKVAKITRPSSTRRCTKPACFSGEASTFDGMITRLIMVPSVGNQPCRQRRDWEWCM